MGMEVLNELRSPLGVLLWQTVQDVHLWAGAPPPRRGELFAPRALDGRLALVRSAGAGAELCAPLAALTTLVRDPAAAAPGEVSDACRRVARWAEGRGLPGTALAYAQAAAVAAPEDAAAALVTARLASERGEDARAESWLRRATALARRSGDGVAYADARLALGHLYARRGDAATARRLYLFALRRARRSGLRRVRAEALHALFDLACTGGISDDADALAQRALRSYGTRHPRAAELLRAWTRHRLVRGVGVPFPGGSWRPTRLRGRAPVRALLLSAVARGAAGAGARSDFEQAWEAAWGILGGGSPPPRGRDARTLLELAHAAAEMEQWGRAEEAARRAREAALRGGDREAHAEVDRFLLRLEGSPEAVDLPQGWR